MIFTCCDDERRRALNAHLTLNGIDYLEVLDRDAPTPSARQKTLLLHLVKRVPPAVDLDVRNVLLEGGERIVGLHAVWAAAADTFPAGLVSAAERKFYTELPDAEHILVVRTDRSGDFSPYSLRLAVDPEDPQPLEGFDPAASRVTFSFKVECPTDLDCQSTHACDSDETPSPPINYLAKDYATFRRLLLDRLSTIMPEWTERSAADLGITLVELLAYVGDRLSYWQDAVATEAYLGTARRRVSVRRHARLVDYRMHEGCNARTWVHLDVNTDGIEIPEGTAVITRVFPGRPMIAPTLSGDIPEEAALLRPIVFETRRTLKTWISHNELLFYTWGDKRCCIPAGATRATLKGFHPHLATNDVLIFEERIGALTGAQADADLRHRCAVRLVDARSTDSGGFPLRDPLSQEQITEIVWDQRDALPMAFTISLRLPPDRGNAPVENVTVALGNNVLADHGQRVRGEPLPDVPGAQLYRWESEGTAPCVTRKQAGVLPRYRPVLAQQPLTHRVDAPPATAPASDALLSNPREALAAIVNLQGREGASSLPWEVRLDLIGSAADDRHCVVEVDDNALATLRFGDGDRGYRPAPGTQFTIDYRIGSGAAGNIGADALSHVVTGAGGIDAVRNPMAAVGGTDPEPISDVRAYAPYAFRRQERAVTERDYGDLCLRRREVQRATASFRWTGSWHTAFVTVDELAGVEPDSEQDLPTFLDRFRMAGVDVAVDRPRFVSLEIDMDVCVKAEYFRSHVKEALLRAFSNRVLSGSERGFFHPDNFTFGQSVFLSEIYRRAQGVPGVESVRVTKFRRQGTRDTQALQESRIVLDRLEIARLDNDPNYPEHGVLRLRLGGGK